MITPQEIEQKDFGRAVRGYNEAEVDTFLNLIILEMQSMQKEIDSLKEENTMLKDKIKYAGESDSSVYETLEAARNLMKDISISAEKRADILLKNAELDAERLRREARDTAERFMEESASIRESVKGLRDRYKYILETEMERFNSLSEGFINEANGIIDELSDFPSKKMAEVEVEEVTDVEDLIDLETETSEDAYQDAIDNRSTVIISPEDMNR